MNAVGGNEAADIRRVVGRIISDLGNPEPPLHLPSALELLKLDLRFYNTEDPSSIDEIVHRMKLAGKQILARPTLLLEAIKKAQISALWVPDSKRIMIDQAVPSLKHRWIEAHEIGHSLIPWHQEFLFGDDELTLDPACHAIVEAEANYAASRLLFLQDRFRDEARSIPFTFASIQKMAKRYGNTIASTLWRFVQDVHPTRPAFGMVSKHPHHPDAIPSGTNENWRHFITSEEYNKRFKNLDASKIYLQLSQRAKRNLRGPVVDAMCEFSDTNGKICEFRVESFSTGYALLTYGLMLE